VDADDLDLVARLDLALLDAAGDDGAAAGDREDVLDRHQERLVDVARRLRDVGVDGLHQLEDLRRPLRVALERLQRRDLDDRDVVAGELVLREQLADLHLDELEQLGVVDHVGLVQATTMYGTSTWRASRMCSRVCGIGPSAAETTRIAPSIWRRP
jgi:hypothetical protein